MGSVFVTISYGRYRYFRKNPRFLLGKKPFCLVLGKTPRCFGEKTFKLLANGVLSLLVTHFQACLQLILLYFTEYVHNYYTILSSTYLLYITAALSFKPWGKWENVSVVEGKKKLF